MKLIMEEKQQRQKLLQKYGDIPPRFQDEMRSDPFGAKKAQRFFTIT